MKRVLEEKLSENFLVSVKFFEKFLPRVKKEHDLDFFLQPFQNCREEGFSAQSFDLKPETYSVVWVTESRNSDLILVLMGDNSDYQDHGMFSERAYRNAETFSSDDMDKAVDHVLAKLGKPIVDLVLLNRNYGRYQQIPLKRFDDAKKYVEQTKEKVIEEEDFKDMVLLEDNKPSGYFDYQGKFHYFSDGKIKLENKVLEEEFKYLLAEEKIDWGVKETLEKIAKISSEDLGELIKNSDEFSLEEKMFFNKKRG